MGLEHIDTIQLVYEPSWQVYQSKTFSPQYPGAFTQSEQFYYHDLGNRYQRYLPYYEADKFVTVPDLNHPLGGEAFRVLPGGGVSQTAYEAPPIDGGVKSLENGLRKLVFEERTTTQNNLAEAPLVLSKYFHYDAKWDVQIDESIATVDTTLGPPCAPPGLGETDPNSLVDTEGCQRFEYVSDAYQSAIPFGYTVYRKADSTHWLCPSSTLDDTYGDLEVLYANPPAQEQRFQPLPYLLSNQLRLRSTHVQVDTLPLPTFVDQTYSLEALPLMDWEEAGADAQLRTIWNPIFPYDALQTAYIHQRQEHGLVTLSEDEKGLMTRYAYGTSSRTWYHDPGCHLNSYMATTLNHIGKPDLITIGVGLPDSLNTRYVYYFDHSVDSVIKPNDHSLHYVYDEYGRLLQAYENDRLLTQSRYHYFLGDTLQPFINRVSGNFVETVTLLDDDAPEAMLGRAFVDPLGRAVNTTSGIVDDYLTEKPAQQVISGQLDYDAWDRTGQAYKPFNFAHPNPNDPGLEPRSNNQDGLASDQFFFTTKFENDHRSRPLKQAKPGEDVNTGHVVTYNYKFINYLQLACELQISLYEQELLFGPTLNAGTGNSPNLHVFRRTQTTDEDGKTVIEYSNALGQKVATKAVINPLESAVTLFFYDRYHQLTKVINPEKQQSDYRYNALGWLYEKETVDGGKSKYLYNRSGLVTLMQNGQGRDGEYLPVAQDTVEYFWRYTYDAYNRIEKQERLPAFNPQTNSTFNGALRTQTLSPLLYASQTGSSNDAVSDPLHYYQYVMSNRSSMDWLADAEVAEQNQFQPVAARRSMLDMLYDNSALTEKEWHYNAGFSDLDATTLPANTLTLLTQHRDKMRGNLSHTITYNDGNFTVGNYAIHYGLYSYDAEERPRWQVQQFRAEGITAAEQGLTVRLDYVDYNNLGSLETENIDVNNDGTLDFQNHFVYDGWNRLREVYANHQDLKENGNRLARYQWNNALSLQLTTEYAASCPETDGVVGRNEVIDLHRYFYDVRDRMTALNSSFFDYDLYYDATPLPAYNGTTPGSDQNFNGNINGIRAIYTLGNGAPITVLNPPANFTAPTLFGYQYDGLNRLTAADGIVGDHVQGQAPGSPYFTMGDVTFDYDKIGNFSRLERFLPFDGNGSANSQFEAWQYDYLSGSNRLMQVLPSGVADARQYTYDGAGNVLTDSHRRINSTNYGRENLPFEVTLGDSTQAMLYDHSDARIHKSLTDFSTGAPVTLSREFYLRDAAGNEIGIWDETTDLWSWYHFGTNRFARTQPDSLKQPFANTSTTFPFPSYIETTNNQLNQLVFYVHDHLGNTRLTYAPSLSCRDLGGTLVLDPPAMEVQNAMDYYPYGKVLRQFVQQDAEKYVTTHHERDEGTDLDYRGARYYDADLGRFFGVDVKAEEFLNFSPYSYVVGNPLVFVDEDGKEPVFAKRAHAAAIVKDLNAIYKSKYGLDYNAFSVITVAVSDQDDNITYTIGTNARFDWNSDDYTSHLFDILNVEQDYSVKLVEIDNYGRTAQPDFGRTSKKIMRASWSIAVSTYASEYDPSSSNSNWTFGGIFLHEALYHLSVLGSIEFEAKGAEATNDMRIHYNLKTGQVHSPQPKYEELGSGRDQHIFINSDEQSTLNDMKAQTGNGSGFVGKPR